MASEGWGQLGEVLGGALGGGGSEAAYQAGRLRTAQTENAILDARNQQLKNIAAGAEARARESFMTSVAESGDPKALQLAEALAGGLNPEQYTGAQADVQEMGFRDTLASPEAAADVRFLAGQGVQGKVLNPYDSVAGTGGYVDLRAGDPALIDSPLGESMIDENVAQAELARTRAKDPDLATVSGGGAADGGFKTPANYQLNPDFDPSQPAGPGNEQIIPIAGGPADPNTPGKIGVRERQVVARVANAARNTATDLVNIMSMPSGASAGFLGSGVGANPGSGLMEATWSALKNSISPQEVDFYNATLGGLSNQLRTLEQMGLAGSDALSSQYDALKLVPTDTVGQKMYKLATIRQTVENGLDTVLTTNPLPQETKAALSQIIEDVRKAVPFTPRDVLKLEQSKNPQDTISDVIGDHSGFAPTDTGAGASALPARRNAKGGELMIDAQGNKAYVYPDGTFEEVQ